MDQGSCLGRYGRRAREWRFGNDVDERNVTREMRDRFELDLKGAQATVQNAARKTGFSMGLGYKPRAWQWTSIDRK